MVFTIAHDLENYFSLTHTPNSFVFSSRIEFFPLIEDDPVEVSMSVRFTDTQYTGTQQQINQFTTALENQVRKSKQRINLIYLLESSS